VLGIGKISSSDLLLKSPGIGVNYDVNLYNSDSSPSSVCTIKLTATYFPIKDSCPEIVLEETIPYTGSATTNIVDPLQMMSSLNPNRKRSRLSHTKMKFKVCVHIVKGYDLVGNHLNPVCSVTYKDTTLNTPIVKETSNPQFDHTLYFQEEGHPRELFEEFIEFKVFTAGKITKNLIGEFKYELGLVYEEEEHRILNQKLALTNPHSATVSGYLEVSVLVLGQEENSSSVKEMLRSSLPVPHQQASFTLSLYCAKDLPRMDLGAVQAMKKALGNRKVSKENVDAYLLFKFAGNEVRSEKCRNNTNPEFKQNLHLNFFYPSKCDSLQITLVDWDRMAKDDVIGTVTIPLSGISLLGENGFLPTFGPAWVNIYGAQRKWEFIDPKNNLLMNKGLINGCAYRGRILLELNTQLGITSNVQTSTISEETFNNIKPFRSTSEFMLICQFDQCFLQNEYTEQLEFEVSMGIFGNKEEKYKLSSLSCTNPLNPIYDGDKGYFLPWGKQKPLIMVQCEWEDVTYRLHAVNAISRITKRLQEDLNTLTSHIEAHEGNSELQEGLYHLDALKKQLIKEC
ncbi:unnamed protein product, partial [Meganyctiphanes norvegica]